MQFYERVKKAALEVGISQKELVSRAVDDFIQAQRKEKRRAVLPTTVEQEELVKDFQRRAGSLRWKNVTVEERRKMMQKISKARWRMNKKSKERS
jgi:DNA repair photolyase